MELDLKHLGQTLAIGGVAVYAFLFLLKIMDFAHLPKMFEIRENEKSILDIAVYLAVIFGLGIVIEDLPKDLVAGRQSTPAFLANFLGTDKELRFLSLFEKRKDDMGRSYYVPKPLAEEVADCKAAEPSKAYEGLRNFIDSSGLRGASLKSGAELDSIAAAQARTPLQIDEAKKNINAIFYNAKNRVFRQDNYFSELTEVSTRLNFTRAFAALCLLLALGYGAFFLVACAVKTFIIWKNNGPKELKDRIQYAFTHLLAKDKGDGDKAGESAYKPGLTGLELIKVFILCCLYISAAFASRMAYRSEHISQNLRVFGYSQTFLVSPDSKKGD